MDFTDADMPLANMKDWHTCLKAKQISLFFFFFFFLKQPPLQLTPSYCFFPVFSLPEHKLVWRTNPLTLLLYIWMYVCIYVHILYKCHALATVLCLFTEKGFVDFLSQLWAAHSLTFAVFLCFSSTCVYHLVSFYTSASVVIHNLFLSDNNLF